MLDVLQFWFAELEPRQWWIKDADLEFEIKHKRIIDRFGRYPHRNAVLGRASTEAETAFLREPDSSF